MQHKHIGSNGFCFNGSSILYYIKLSPKICLNTLYNVSLLPSFQNRLVDKPVSVVSLQLWTYVSRGLANLTVPSLCIMYSYSTDCSLLLWKQNQLKDYSVKSLVYGTNAILDFVHVLFIFCSKIRFTRWQKVQVAARKKEDLLSSVCRSTFAIL